MKTINTTLILILSFVTLFFLTGCKDNSISVNKKENLFTLNTIEVPEAGKKVSNFKKWIEYNYNKLNWKKFPDRHFLNDEILKSSLDLGSNFLINNQKPEGNFNYEYDFVTKKFDMGDNQVRQAGALWGVSLIFAFNQDPEIQKALDKSLKFFLKYTVKGSTPGSKVIFYPGDTVCKTGTVALVALGIIEYLRTEKAGLVKLDDRYREKLENNLRGYLQHLLSLQFENAHFAEVYSPDSAEGTTRYNPYADGEVLLCIIKAAKYLDYTELKPVFRNSALLIAKDYTMDQWPRDPDSYLTKGFYQWSSMAFWEYQDAGWEDSDMYGDYVVNMAWWMIYTHRTLQRTRNTAYAYEGIVHAYQIAKSRNNEPAISTLRFTVDAGLSKLISWQVGGPLQYKNRFLTSFGDFPPVAIGGVMNHRMEPLLRIDVTQHQMHAVIIALKYFNFK